MNNAIGSIGELAAIFTVAGVAVYVLGLIGLAIPIRRVFTGDLSTAWYAVALVPKTVVAGQGVRIWLRWPIVLTILLCLTAVVEKISINAFYILLGLCLLAGTVVIGTQSGALDWDSPSYPMIGLIIFVFSTSGVTVIAGVVYVTREGTDLLGLILIFVGSFIYGLLPAIAAVPPLPEVEVTKQDKGEEVPDPVKGYLVAHSEGFWYLFEESNDLLSIPDDQVSSVRIIRKQPEEEPEPEWKYEPLSEVEVIKKHRGKKEPDPVKGYLLDHSHGYWRLIFQGDKEMVIIPDDKVSSVRIITPAHRSSMKIGTMVDKQTGREEEAKPSEEAK